MIMLRSGAQEACPFLVALHDDALVVDLTQERSSGWAGWGEGVDPFDGRGVRGVGVYWAWLMGMRPTRHRVTGNGTDVTDGMDP